MSKLLSKTFFFNHFSTVTNQVHYVKTPEIKGEDNTF